MTRLALLRAAVAASSQLNRSRVVWLLFLALAGGLLFSPGTVRSQIVTPSALENSPYDVQSFKIADQLQCPVCQGVTVAYSNSGLAQQMRVVIKKKLEQGESREQILQYFVERYGESILTNPPKSGFTALVWLLPVVGLLIGAGTVGYALRSWRNRIPWPARNPSLSLTNELETRPNLAEDEELRLEAKQRLEPAVPVSVEVRKEYEERVERELAHFADPVWPDAEKLRQPRVQEEQKGEASP